MDRAMERTVRRRRSWYRRRSRRRRALVALVLGAALAGACWQNIAYHLSLPTLHAYQILPDSFLERQKLKKDSAFTGAPSIKPMKSLRRIPGVYPYSVVPGGVKNPGDLRYAMARDYAVRRHYANFDYSQAHLVRATEAREVFLSYRIRDTIFWTRRRVRLQPGELLLTDGKITARARCGNQISDTAKPEVSNEEPDEDVLDQPVAQLEPGPGIPIRPVLGAPDLPSGVPMAPHLFGSPFVFPYVPVSLPVPSGACPVNDELVDGHCRHKKHKPGAAPEPSTLLLIGSGLALIAWRYRRTGAPIAS